MSGFRNGEFPNTFVFGTIVNIVNVIILICTTTIKHEGSSANLSLPVIVLIVSEISGLQRFCNFEGLFISKMCIHSLVQMSIEIG